MRQIRIGSTATAMVMAAGIGDQWPLAGTPLKLPRPATTSAQVQR